MAVDSTFFGKLKTLFSSTITTQYKAGKNKLKVLDIDKLQATKNLETNRVVDKFTGARASRNSYGQMFTNQTGYAVNKNELYREYESMEQDPILSSALDIYADECTTRNEYGEILQIQSDSEQIQDDLHNLFYDILNVDFNLWPWIRSLAKYGDYYLHLDIVENIGITNVIPISQYSMTREDDPNSNICRFKYDSSLGSNAGYGGMGTHQYFQSYEIAHFRILSDINYLPYGRSVFEGGRKIWKSLQLMEDAMLIYRIMRAPQKRVFKIDVGNIAPHEVDGHIQKIIDKLKKVPYIDQTTGEYNLEFNLQNMMEDFYLPVRGDKSGTEIATLDSAEGTMIEDIKYLQNKLFAALKIPKSYLTYEEDINSKGTAIVEDMRFTRTIERLQRIVVSELNKIAMVHLYSKGYSDDDLVNFELKMNLPSAALEEYKINTWKAKIDLASSAKGLKLLSDEWIYDNIFNMSDEEYDEERSRLVKDGKIGYRYSQIEQTGKDPAIVNQQEEQSQDSGMTNESLLLSDDFFNE